MSILRCPGSPFPCTLPPAFCVLSSVFCIRLSVGISLPNSLTWVRLNLTAAERTNLEASIAGVLCEIQKEFNESEKQVKRLWNHYTMLIYLDANLVQYCADYSDFILGDTVVPSVNEPLLRELKALRRIFELEQLGEGWHVAAPTHLMQELLCKPKPEQREVYSTLLRAWQEAGLQEANEASEENIGTIERSLYALRLKDKDRRHLAEAIALRAVWFLTNDKKLINHTRPRRNKKVICTVQGVYVARPSECIPEISKGLFLKIGELH